MPASPRSWPLLRRRRSEPPSSRTNATATWHAPWPDSRQRRWRFELVRKESRRRIRGGWCSTGRLVVRTVGSGLGAGYRSAGSIAVVLLRLLQGVLRGSMCDGVASFRGVPYAPSPFDARRFAAPGLPPVWEGERDATCYGPTAPKPPYPVPIDTLLPEPVIPGEECLNLNVWTPDPGTRGLPVLVWIHGGAFVNGSGAVGGYDGSSFARDGVVCVTINYRLGVDGLPAADRRDPRQPRPAGSGRSAGVGAGEHRGVWRRSCAGDGRG